MNPKIWFWPNAYLNSFICWWLYVTIVADFSFDKHVSNVGKTCFLWLRQLRRVRRSLDVESVKNLRLVNALAHQGLITATLFWLLHRRESQTSGSPFWMLLSDQNSKYERGGLSWLTVHQRVRYKLAVVHRCFQHWAPRYLADYSILVSEVPGCQRVWMVCQLLSTVCCSRCSFGSHALCCRTNGLECSARWAAGSSCQL